MKSRTFVPLMLFAICVEFNLFAQTNLAVSKWEKEIAAFEARDRTNPPPKQAILFVGSSTIRLWDLKRDFPGKQVINRGFGGSQIEDATALAERIIFPYEPRVIVFYSGDNDLAAGKSPERVFADFQAFAKKVHEHLPDTVIDCISIKPCPARWKLREKVMAVNAQIKTLPDPKLHFIDIYPLMLGEDGKPKADLFKADGLHPSAKCYRMWVEKIGPLLNTE